MNKRIKLRSLFVGGIITLLFVILLGRVYFVQVVKADFWFEKARETWAAYDHLEHKRGTITDRQGRVLAMDALAYTVAVNPQVINKLGIADEVVARLHDILGKSEKELRDLVTAKRKDGTYYAQREIRPEGWKIDKALSDQVAAFRDELKARLKEQNVGIYLLSGQKRFYPKKTLASHLLGFVNKEGNAVYGLEASFDDVIGGEDGAIKYQRDGKQVQLAQGEVEYKPARDGKNITLTIDSEIQHYVEEAIGEAQREYNPKSITAIAVDPNTMEILALANTPNYDPNTYWSAKTANFYNHAIQSLYEPGSTFKIVTLASAVQEGLFNPNATFMSGNIRIGKDTVKDHNGVGWGEISYLDGVKHSSNVAFVKLGQALGPEKLRDYITAFGFGQKTGIQLPAEVAGSVNFRSNIPIEVATVTFGQGVAVTPIQQVAAVAAVANGGKLLQPQLIKQIEDPVTKQVTKVEPKVVRQVISPETSRKVGEYLEQVVSDQKIGTGRNAYIEGYRIAGKTGTAQKWDNAKRGYSNDKYVVSFIGYAPVENPKVLLYVLLDEPDVPYAGGGSVAAPIFKSIMQKTLRYLGIPPKLSDAAVKDASKDATVKVPDVTGKAVNTAKSELRQLALSYETVGKGGKVLQQIPQAGAVIQPSQRIYLVTESRDKLAVPNMRGLSLRDAMEICSLLGIRIVAEGEGYVVSQMVAKQNGERVVKIVLKPSAPSAGEENRNGTDGAKKETDEPAE
ncbi:stage V sporulation protein D [Paenibacillus cisolokensis]|uniref:Stage V sporulation protein D n=1 Tax=Paenibacillus cisolokensis TaxID=1658519 RepID=A0ABQ4N7G7_9BACL|nr:PASTA domain-containing penicillin-binding protein [Paenibacillus cisolokensis]GIQ64131.1 stage V sporulation protein D [Paenibacillus cisolokensis]